MSARERATPQPAAVLTKAVLKAANQLGLKQTELARILGMHRTAISRLKTTAVIDPNAKEGELALLLIRVARALFALTGGDETWMRHFLRTPNTVTGGVPAAQMASIQGLVNVLQLVDALRVKV